MLEQPLKTIAVIRALKLGDLICVTPCFRALRVAYPDAHIALIGLPWAAAFVERVSHLVDELIPLPGWPGLVETEPQLERIPAFLQSMQDRRFDLVLQVHGSGGITNPLALLLGGRQTAGFYRADQYNPGELFIEYPEDCHEIQVTLRLLEHLGIPTQGEELEFNILPRDRRAAKRLLQSTGETAPYAVIHPGANSGGRWAVEKFAMVADWLAQEGLRIVMTGTEAERSLTRAVANCMRSPVLDMTGQTGLGTMAAVLEGTRLLVCNDTGVSHMAAAVRARSIVLFTTSHPQRWAPLNRRLHHIVTGADQAEPEAVIAEAQNLLQEGTSGTRSAV